MKVEEFKNWADQQIDHSCFSDGDDGSADNRVKALLIKAFYLGQGVDLAAVDRMEELQDQIFNLTLKLEGLAHDVRRPHPETVVDTIATAVTQIDSRLAAVEMRIAETEHVSVERGVIGGFSRQGGEAPASPLTRLVGTVTQIDNGNEPFVIDDGVAHLKDFDISHAVIGDLVVESQKASASQLVSLETSIGQFTGNDDDQYVVSCSSAVSQIPTSLEASLGMVSADPELSIAYHGIKDKSS